MPIVASKIPADPAPPSPLSIYVSFLAGRFDALRLAAPVGAPPGADAVELGGYLAGYRGRPCA